MAAFVCDSCAPAMVQPRADYRVLYMRARRKIHVLRSVVFVRRARQLCPMPQGRPGRVQEPLFGVMELQGIGLVSDRPLSDIAECDSPACVRCREVLVPCAAVLAILSTEERRVLCARQQATLNSAATADAIVACFLGRPLCTMRRLL